MFADGGDGHHAVSGPPQPLRQIPVFVLAFVRLCHSLMFESTKKYQLFVYCTADANNVPSNGAVRTRGPTRGSVVGRAAERSTRTYRYPMSCTNTLIYQSVNSNLFILLCDFHRTATEEAPTRARRRRRQQQRTTSAPEGPVRQVRAARTRVLARRGGRRGRGRGFADRRSLLQNLMPHDSSPRMRITVSGISSKLILTFFSFF